LRITFSKDVNTPLPIVPIVIAATAIGTAASVAGLGLQGAQYAEYLRQIPEQKRLIELQTKIAQYQLDQFEESKKEENMLKAPAVIPRPMLPPTMLTRSMVRMGTQGDLRMNTPRLNRPVTPMQAANVLGRPITPPTPADAMEMRERPRGGLINAAFRNVPGSPQLVMNWAEFNELPADQFRAGPARASMLSRFRTSAVDRFGRIRPFFTTLRRRIAPTRAYRGQDLQRLFADVEGLEEEQRPSMLARFRRSAGRVGTFLKRHKRKIAVGAALGGAALIGGLAGGLSGKKEEMREGNTGTLGQLIKGVGGGGGSGGGGYSGFGRRLARRVKRRRVSKRKSAPRKQKGKRKSKKKHSVKRLKRKFVGAKRINKRRRNKKKRFAAF